MLDRDVLAVPRALIQRSFGPVLGVRRRAGKDRSSANSQRQRCGRSSTRKMAHAPSTAATPMEKRTSATCGPGILRETSRASMAMAANKVADTSRLAEARWAKLG